MNINISIFDSLLNEGEFLEWVGKSEPFKLMEGVHKKKLSLRFLICAVAAIALTAAYIISVSASGGQIQVFIPVITIGVPLFFIIRSVMDYGIIKKKLIYAITNKRLIVYQSETNTASIDLDKIGEIKIVDKGNGVGDVAFGPDAASAPEDKYRYIAISPKNKYENDEKIFTGLVFYNVAELKKIKSLLDKGIKVTECVAG